MIHYGISTACFYPLETELAVERLTARQIPGIEIFLNSVSELEPAYLKNLREKLDGAGCRVLSLHPFSSGFEPFLFFSEYERRYRDSVELYQRYFEAACLLGAKIVVFHGDRKGGRLPEKDYFERYAGLRDAAKSQGVLLAQENIGPGRSGSLGFLTRMRDYLKDVSFVLDVKQAVRGGEDPMEIARTLNQQIVHLHVSDHTPQRDCLPVGTGEFPFQRLLQLFAGQNREIGAVVELYRESYQEEGEIFASFDRLTAQNLF